jgi:hypothetical protein
VNYCSVFPHDFFMIFSKIIFVNFIFFNIKLVKNYNYNKTKSYGKSVVVFFKNTVNCYSISLNGFFMIFSKTVFVDFIGENTIVFLTKHCQLLQYFFSWVFFLLKLSLSIFFNIKLVENLAL